MSTHCESIFNVKWIRNYLNDLISNKVDICLVSECFVLSKLEMRIFVTLSLLRGDWITFKQTKLGWKDGVVECHFVFSHNLIIPILPIRGHVHKKLLKLLYITFSWITEYFRKYIHANQFADITSDRAQDRQS